MTSQQDKNGMGDIFYLPDPHNAAKSWDIFTNQYKFPMKYIKMYIENPIKDKPVRPICPPESELVRYLLDDHNSQ